MSSASEVPKAKSPRTHSRMEDCDDAKAVSGQSIKLGKVARKWALVRYSGDVELCAASENEKIRNANNVSAAMVRQERWRNRQAGGFARGSRNTGSPRLQGQTSGHLGSA